jgi:hypothetical protein
MYVTVVPNRGSPPVILLRETYRETGKVKNRTLANLSKWKPEKIAALRAVLRDQPLLPAEKGFEIVRSLSHAHAAALGIARRLGLDPRVKAAELMPPGMPRTRLLALALIVARLQISLLDEREPVEITSGLSRRCPTITGNSTRKRPTPSANGPRSNYLPSDGVWKKVAVSPRRYLPSASAHATASCSATATGCATSASSPTVPIPRTAAVSI